MQVLCGPSNVNVGPREIDFFFFIKVLLELFIVAEVPKAALFPPFFFLPFFFYFLKNLSLVYLSGGKIVEHLIWTWCIGLFFWAVGKKKILFIETKSDQHPPLLPVLF